MPSGERTPDPLLVRYLLGTLPDHETERLDELSIADDEFAIRLRTTEHDLVDAYVRGELSGDTLDGFRAHYLSTKAGRDKVAFAEALQARRTVAVSDGVRRGAGGPSFALRLVPVWGLAAAATIVVTIAGFLFADNLRLRREVADARALLEHRPSPPEASASDAPRPESTIARNGPPDVAPPPAIVLFPQRRGVAEAPAMPVPRSGSVTVHLVLEFDDFPRYTIDVKEAGGAIVWHGPVLVPTSIREGRAVSATVPVSVLRTAPRYVFEVAGQRSREPAELVGTYPVRAVLQ